MPRPSAFTFNFRHFQMDLNPLNWAGLPRSGVGCPRHGMSSGGIGKRKADHLELAATGDVGFERTTTLFECVKLVHQSLPELALSQVDTSVTLFGKRLRAPLVIASMTGGVDRALAI